MDARNITSGNSILPEYHLEAAFMHLPYGVCLIDLQGVIQRVNPQTSIITGYEAEELTGRLMAEILHEEDARILAAEVEGMMASGRNHVRVEKRFIRKDGEVIWTKSGISVIFQHTGVPQMIMCTLEDISEKKALQQEKNQAIRALSKREQEYEALFSFSPDGIAILDEDGRFLRVNHQISEILRFPKEDFTGKLLTDLLANEPGEVRKIQEAIESAKEGRVVALKTNFETRDLTSIICELRVNGIQIEGQLFLQVILKDITEAELAVRQSTESQTRLESIMKAVRSRIFLLDIDGTILYSNQDSGKLIRGNFIGLSLLDYCQTDAGREQLSNALKVCKETKQEVQFLTEIVDLEGQKNELQIFLNPLVNDGIVTGFTLLRNNVTSLNKTYRESKENAARLASVMEAIGARIFHLDKDGLIIYSNQKDGRVIFGDFIGKQWLDFARSEEERTLWQQSMGDCTASLAPVEYFSQTTYPDGSPKYLLHQVAPILTDGELSGYTVTRHDITHIEKTHQALRENEARLRSVMETVHSRILQIDLEGNILYVNKTGNGLTVEDLTGSNMARFAHDKQEIEHWKAIMDACKSGRKAIEFTRRQSYPDGSELDLLIQMSPVITEDKVVGFTIIRNDITSFEAANRMLRESEENYRSIVEGSDTRIATIGLDDRIIYLNKPFPGYRKEDMVGQNLLKFFPEDGREYWQTVKNQVITTGQATNYEYSLVQADGSRKSYFDILSPRFHENTIIGFTIISRDITATKKLQQDHLEALTVLRTTVDATGIGTYEWDIADTNLITWDDNTHKIFGLNPGEFDGRLETFMSFIHPDDKGRVEEATDQAIHLLDQANISYRIILKGGEIRWVSTRRIIIRDRNGVAQRMKGVTWDITDEKIREETNLRAARLEAQNQELKEFTYIASHDLQSPLRTIGNFAGILAEDYSEVLGDSGLKYLQIIQEGIHRMRDLITDLLDYSRIGQEQEYEITDLNILVQAILRDMHHQLSQTKGIVHTKPLPSIPIQKTSFRLLLQNLISNSLKFQAEGVIPEVVIDAKEANGEYVFSITDNGIGIHPDYHQKIFQVFQRLHNQSEYEGTGIGLAHCEKVVGLHGGKIWVESEEGKGSTFRFTIPKSSSG